MPRRGQGRFHPQHKIATSSWRLTGLRVSIYCLPHPQAWIPFFIFLSHLLSILWYRLTYSSNSIFSSFLPPPCADRLAGLVFRGRPTVCNNGSSSRIRKLRIAPDRICRRLSVQVPAVMVFSTWVMSSSSSNNNNNNHYSSSIIKISSSIH